MTISKLFLDYNVGQNPDFEAMEILQGDQSVGNEATIGSIPQEQIALNNRFDQLSLVNEYENDNILSQLEHPKRSTITASEVQSNNNQDASHSYKNLPSMSTLERSQSLARTSSLTAKSTGAIRKIPESLKLRSDDQINNNNHAEDKSIYRASGPYIPLSDCFSGSPVLFVSLTLLTIKAPFLIASFQKNENDPKTPLNSLDPKFYDTPRSHIANVGLNLTDDQPNSPKRNNVQTAMITATKYDKNAPRSLNSSPADSEGGSTDEESTELKIGGRKIMPSGSSMDNESIAITAGQSYMKVIAGNSIPLPPKRASLVLEKKQESSDTEENTSPITQIGPKDSSCCVDDRYDFPRSYNVQGFTGSLVKESLASVHGHGHLMTSTPNLIHSGASTLDCSQLNFYSNAAPRENNIFRFDFSSTAPPPEVNRTLKPRKELNGHGLKRVQPAPTVDRKLKPCTSKVKSSPLLGITEFKCISQQHQMAIGTNSLKRLGPESLSLSEVDDSSFMDVSLVNFFNFKYVSDFINFLHLLSTRISLLVLHLRHPTPKIACSIWI